MVMGDFTCVSKEQASLGTPHPSSLALVGWGQRQTGVDQRKMTVKRPRVVGAAKKGDSAVTCPRRERDDSWKTRERDDGPRGKSK